MTDKIVAVPKLTNHPGVPMWMWIFDGKGHFVEDRALYIHFDDPGVSGFGDHRQPTSQSLKGVDLDLAGIAGLGLGFVLPNDLLRWIDLDHSRVTGMA